MTMFYRAARTGCVSRVPYVARMRCPDKVCFAFRATQEQFRHCTTLSGAACNGVVYDHACHDTHVLSASVEHEKYARHARTDDIGPASNAGATTVAVALVQAAPMISEATLDKGFDKTVDRSSCSIARERMGNTSRASLHRRYAPSWCPDEYADVRSDTCTWQYDTHNDIQHIPSGMPGTNTWPSELPSAVRHTVFSFNDRREDDACLGDLKSRNSASTSSRPSSFTTPRSLRSGTNLPRMHLSLSHCPEHGEEEDRKRVCMTKDSDKTLHAGEKCDADQRDMHEGYISVSCETREEDDDDASDIVVTMPDILRTGAGTPLPPAGFDDYSTVPATFSEDVKSTVRRRHSCSPHSNNTCYGYDSNRSAATHDWHHGELKMKRVQPHQRHHRSRALATFPDETTDSLLLTAPSETAVPALLAESQIATSSASPPQKQLSAATHAATLPAEQSSVGQDVIDLVTDAFKEQREAEVKRRRQVLYDMTHPHAEHYTYAGKLVPPPPLSFGLVTEEAKALGNRVMRDCTYHLVRQTGTRVPAASSTVSPVGATHTTAMVNPAPRYRGSKRESNVFREHNYYFEVNELYQEIVLVGKANAGKSSLLNALLGQRVARSSSTPNTTKHISFYQSVSPKELCAFHAKEHHNQLVKLPGGGLQLTFVDIPGFGIEGMSDAWRDAVVELTDAYFGVRRSVNTVLFCMDCERGLTKSDMKYFQWLENVQGVFFVVLTKCDSVPHSRVCSVMRQVYSLITTQRRKYRRVFPFIIPTSAHTGVNVEMLRGIIAETSGLVPGDRLRELLKEKQTRMMAEALAKEAERVAEARAMETAQAQHFFVTTVLHDVVNLAASKDDTNSRTTRTSAGPSNMHRNHGDAATMSSPDVPILDAGSAMTHTGVTQSTTYDRTGIHALLSGAVQETPTSTNFMRSGRSSILCDAKSSSSAPLFDDDHSCVRQEEDEDDEEAAALFGERDEAHAGRRRMTHIQARMAMPYCTNVEESTAAAALCSRVVTQAQASVADARTVTQRQPSLPCPYSGSRQTHRTSADANNKTPLHPTAAPCSKPEKQNVTQIRTDALPRAPGGVSRATLYRLNTGMDNPRSTSRNSGGSSNKHTGSANRTRDGGLTRNTNHKNSNSNSSDTDTNSNRGCPDGGSKETESGSPTVGLVSQFLSRLESYGTQPRRSRRARGHSVGSKPDSSAMSHRNHRLMAEDASGRLVAHSAGRPCGPALLSCNSAVETRQAEWKAHQLKQMLQRENATAPWSALPSLSRKMGEEEQRAAVQGMRKKELSAYLRDAGRVIHSFEKFEGEVTAAKYMNESRQVRTLRSQQQMHLNATAKINYRSMPPGLFKRYGEMNTYWPTPRVLGRNNDESHH